MKKKKLSAALPALRPERASGVHAPRRRPFRLWMTGSLALVMLSFASVPELPDLSDDERPSAVRLHRHSPYDVIETVRRIEAAAAERGLGVLARVDIDGPVLVLASASGATPVVIAEEGAAPQLPLSVQVRACESGGAQVWIAHGVGEAERDWQALPRAVLDDLAALPHCVEAALEDTPPTAHG